MSDEIRSKVETILADAGVTFSAVYIRETKREDWKCDQWSTALTKGDGREAHEEFDFFTGLGHRKPNDSAMAQLSAASLAKVSKRMLAWENHYKQYPDKPQTPHAADVLHSIVMDGSACEMSFADWCDTYGYEEDSRKALATYEACQQGFDKLRKVLTSAQINALRDALQDY